VIASPFRKSYGPTAITVALVNNMPDSAFVATEEQFRRVAACAPDGASAHVDLYTFPGIAHSESVASAIRARYRSLDDLWKQPPDALIVTGNEPKHQRLDDEPYWPNLARLMEWAANAVPTTLLSCLSAHAFTLLFDGIERAPCEVKCSGVFEGVVGDRRHPLTAGLAEQAALPHSRLNDVPEGELLQAGYQLVIGSGPANAGWAVATCERGSGLFVLCQGHPEYETLSLLREYRRDVRRHLLGEMAIPYPRLPEGYLTAQATARLEEFAQQAAEANGDARSLWDSFPYDDVASSVKNTWAVTSTTLYRNWMRLASKPVPLAA
jgi:homoserine O-succinyltransferase